MRRFRGRKAPGKTRAGKSGYTAASETSGKPRVLNAHRLRAPIGSVFRFLPKEPFLQLGLEFGYQVTQHIPRQACSDTACHDSPRAAGSKNSIHGKPRFLPNISKTFGAFECQLRRNPDVSPPSGRANAPPRWAIALPRTRPSTSSANVPVPSGSGFCKSVTKILCLNLPCYHPLAVFLRPLGTRPHATFGSDKEVALVASFRIRTCWPASVAFQVVLILPEA
jgi:hypothetical protein